MSTEKKEGIVIVALCVAMLAICLLRTSWFQGGLPATVYLFDGFEVSCDSWKPGCSYDGTKQLLQIDFELSSALIVLVPLFTYGLLRGLGIVRRLFPFEERLFRRALRSGSNDFAPTKPDT